MKKITLYLTLILIAGAMLLLYPSCRKVPNGFLTSYPYYDQSPMVIGKGYAFTSSPLETIGSTIPMNMKILHVYDGAGNNVDNIFLKSYPLSIFTSYYDYHTDTTLALFKAITKIVDTPSIGVNSANGSFQTNFNTIHLPTGSYTFDLQITNSAGTKVYPKIAEFILKDTTSYITDQGGAPYNRLYEVGNESKSKSLPNPIITVQRIADTPNVVIMKMTDENGTPFDPSKGEIIRRPYPGTNVPQPYLQTLQDYSLGYVTTDSSMNFYYPPITPFPLHSLGNAFFIYYRIPTQFMHITGQPDGMWSANPRFYLRIMIPGEYEVTVQLPDITHS